MARSRKKSTLATMVTGTASTVLNMLASLVYVNLLIRNYGSEINGLISSVTQFVSMFTVLEGGFATAAVVALYAPLLIRDYRKVNDILYTGKRYLGKVALLIAVCVGVGGFFFLRSISSPLNDLQTVLVLALCLLTTLSAVYNLSLYSVVLQSDNREYVVHSYTMIARFVSILFQIALVLAGADIVVIFSGTLLNNVISILLLRRKVKKTHPAITYRGEYHKAYIKGSNDVLAQKIANTVFESTDLVLVSSCIGLAAASVYNVYNQIFNAIHHVVVSISKGPMHSFGQLFAEGDFDKCKKLSREYAASIYLLAGIAFSMTGCLICPFLQVYARNFGQYDYVISALAILFFSYFYFKSVNRAYAMVLNVSGNFKKQNVQTILGAIVNLAVSLAFIPLLGLSSIILGSFVATIIIAEMNMIRSFQFLHCEGLAKEHVVLWSNYLVIVGMIALSLRLNLQCASYLQWMLLAIPVAVVCIAAVLGLNLLFFGKEIKAMLGRFSVGQKTKTNG